MTGPKLNDGALLLDGELLGAHGSELLCPHALHVPARACVGIRPEARDVEER